MRGAYVYDLPGHFGPIEADGIWKRVEAYHIDRLYFDVRQIDKHIIDVCHSHHVQAGISIDPKSWFNEDFAAAALRVHNKLNELGFTGAHVADPCPILFDYEDQSIERVVAGLKAWRKLRYKRDTCWSMEPLQGGWVTDPQMVTQIAPDLNLTLLPQTYRWNMAPVVQDAVLMDLMRPNTYSRLRIRLYYQSFYKTATTDLTFPIQEAWDGVMYDLEHTLLP